MVNPWVLLGAAGVAAYFWRMQNAAGSSSSSTYDAGAAGTSNAPATPSSAPATPSSASSTSSTSTTSSAPRRSTTSRAPTEREQEFTVIIEQMRGAAAFWLLDLPRLQNGVWTSTHARALGMVIAAARQYGQATAAELPQPWRDRYAYTATMLNATAVPALSTAQIRTAGDALAELLHAAGV